jgi:hypothetical protein
VGLQFVTCVLTFDLVVAANADWQVDSDTADAQEPAITEVVFERLRPLIPVRHGPPRWPGGRVLPSPGSILGVSAFDLARLTAIDR